MKSKTKVMMVRLQLCCSRIFMLSIDIEGVVQSIGDAAVSIDGVGNVYRVDISLNDVPMDLIKIGQEGTCDIIIGKRTILNYFLEPFIYGLKDSMHER